MAKKPSSSNNNQNYLALSVVFFVIGVTMIVSNISRASGIPFMVIGVAFFIISQQNPKNK